MTRADLLERAAFWRDGLMDVDHLRDVAYEAVASEFDNEGFRRIAGDARLSTDDARILFDAALRRAGVEPPAREVAARIVCASIARSILAGSIEPITGGSLIADRTHDEHPSEVFGPIAYASCTSCLGLDENSESDEPARRVAELREDLREHLRRNLPAIEAWAGLAAPATHEGTVRPSFLGWRRPTDSPRADLVDLGRRVRSLLVHLWDPIEIARCPEARDEYDGCVLQVSALLLSDASDHDVAHRLAAYLENREAVHMGLDATEESARRRELAVRELIALRPPRRARRHVPDPTPGTGGPAVG